jgi:hypothetical protein
MLDYSRNRFPKFGRNTPRFMKVPLSNRKAASKYKILGNGCSLDLLSGSELAPVLAVYFAITPFLHHLAWRSGPDEPIVQNQSCRT